MSHPIGPLTPPPSSQPSDTPDVPLLSKQMQDQVLAMADQLQKVLDDPSLADQKTFLNDFVHNANQLNQTVEQALRLR